MTLPLLVRQDPKWVWPVLPIYKFTSFFFRTQWKGLYKGIPIIRAPQSQTQKETKALTYTRPGT